MRLAPPIRPALVGIFGAAAVLLIGLTPAGAIAATHANAQQSRSIAAAHPAGAQSAENEPGWTQSRPLPCGTDEPQITVTGTGSVIFTANIRTGPRASCNIVGIADLGDPLNYFCSSNGWTFLEDTSTGSIGWVSNTILAGGGSTTPCQPPPPVYCNESEPQLAGGPTGSVTQPSNIWNGPGEQCAEVGQAATSDILQYYCEEAGWTYLQDTNTGVLGWVPNLLLSGQGSQQQCPKDSGGH
jgi:Bacterial SH3 domain